MTTVDGAEGVPNALERAHLSVTCGPLARALAARFVAALSAETQLPIDRVEEACLVAEALADRCAEITPDGELDLTVTVLPDRLELRVGPLRAGAAGRLLGTDAGQPGGGAIRGLASSVETRRGRDGRETLRVVVGLDGG